MWKKLQRPSAQLTLLIGLSVAIHVPILLTSQAHADGDEAVVGLMAKHVWTLGERPVFYYGQAYGGGGALEAYLAAGPLAWFGRSGVVLKSVALATWLATLALVFVFCRRHLGATTAVLSAAVLLTATPLVEWHLKMRGGYAALPLFLAILLLLFSDAAYGGRQAAWRFIALGFAAGLAWYNQELALPFLAALFLFSLRARPVFWRRKAALLVVLGLVAGAAPLIAYNAAHGCENVARLLSLGGAGRVADTGRNVARLFSHDLPGFFVGRNVDQFVRAAPAAAWAELAVYAVLVLSLLTRAGRLPGPVALLLCFLPLHLAVYAASGATGGTPRYLLALYPALAILAGHGAARCVESRATVQRVLGAAAAAALLGLGLRSHAAYVGPAVVNDDVIVAGEGCVNRATPAHALSNILAVLREHGIRHARCTYFVQWRLLFESDEEVVASSYGLYPGALRYPAYDVLVARSKRFAVVFHKDDMQLPKFLESPLARQFSGHEVDDYRVFLPEGELDLPDGLAYRVFGVI